MRKPGIVSLRVVRRQGEVGGRLQGAKKYRGRLNPRLKVRPEAAQTPCSPREAAARDVEMVARTALAVAAALLSTASAFAPSPVSQRLAPLAVEKGSVVRIMRPESCVASVGSFRRRRGPRHIISDTVASIDGFTRHYSCPPSVPHSLKHQHC